MTKLDQIKLEIYERCDSGMISEDDKIALLESAEENYAEDELLLESYEEVEDFESTILEAVENEEISFVEAGEILLEAGADASKVKEIYAEDVRDTSYEIMDKLKEVENYLKLNEFTKAMATTKIAELKMKRIQKMVNDADLKTKVEPTELSTKDKVYKSIAIAIPESIIGAIAGCAIACGTSPDAEVSMKRKIAGGVAGGTLGAGFGVSAAFHEMKTAARRKMNNAEDVKKSVIKFIDKALVEISNLKFKIKSAKKEYETAKKQSKLMQKSANYIRKQNEIQRARGHKLNMAKAKASQDINKQYKSFF